MTVVDIPLFPLHTVLFPGGVLPLRIFEPRYLTMIGERMKAGAGFGVVLLRDGQEAGGEAATFYATGTEASVVDFDQLDDGMLGVTCRGGQMLRVQSHRLQPDRLIVGSVERLPPEPVRPVPEEYGEMTTFLRRLLARDDARDYRRWLQEDWNSADWLGCRLTELLPLSLSGKQTLLETDAMQRLAVLHALMQDNRLFDQMPE